MVVKSAFLKKRVILSFSHSLFFFLSLKILFLSPAKFLKHRQVKYCITIVLVWSKSNIFDPFGDTWRHFKYEWRRLSVARTPSRERKIGRIRKSKCAKNSRHTCFRIRLALRGSSPRLFCVPFACPQRKKKDRS